MAHRPIAIDGAGTDGSAEGAGGVQSGPSNDHGGDWACIDQGVVPTAPPPSSPERPRQICSSPPCSERALASQAPQISALGVETLYGVREGGASQHRRLHNMYVAGAYALWFWFQFLFVAHSVF